MGTRRDRIVVRAAFVLFGWWWAWRRLRHTYFFFDEWSMVGRTLHTGPLEGMTTQFNGHLWVFQDVIYRIQVGWFGLDDHWFVVATFLLSLATLQLVLSAIFERVGMSFPAGLMLATLLTYLGAAAQNFVFAVQVSPTFAAATAYAPALVVLGRRSSRGRLVAVGGLVLASTMFDSGFGLVGWAFAAVLVVREWSPRDLVALAPAGVVLALWYGFADLGREIYPSDLGRQVAFAPRLLARSAGALLGGGPVVGTVLLAVAVFVAAFIRRTAITPERTSLALAGLVATGVIVVGISRNRAGIPDIPWREFNRYFQNVGVPLVLAFTPLVLAAVDGLPGARELPRAIRTGTVPVALVAAFLLGVPAEQDYGDDFVAWNGQVRRELDAALGTLARGCPAGTELDPAARPMGSLNPQIRVGFLVELVDRGLLDPDPDPDAAVDPVVAERMCPTG